MSNEVAARDFDELVREGKIQTYNWTARDIAVQLASKKESSREERIQFANAVVESANRTAGYFLHRRKG